VSKVPEGFEEQRRREALERGDAEAAHYWSLPPDERDKLAHEQAHEVNAEAKKAGFANLAEYDEYRIARTKERVRRRARRDLDAEELDAARGPRMKRTAKEYAKVEQPAAVINNVLAAEVNLLGGPTEAGKSLLARDWAIPVAWQAPKEWGEMPRPNWRGYTVVESRPVLLIASEGLHDFRERWENQPGWEQAAGRIYVMDEPVDLVHGNDVGWLLKEYAAERPGLVIFDVIYGMGMASDDGTKDVIPVLGAMKRISAEWKAATLALGHPGHNAERRFRGSSAWRQLAATEWHMAEESLTCEKSKIANKATLGAGYVAEYPNLRYLDVRGALDRVEQRNAAIKADIAAHPEDSTNKRASRLAPSLGVSTKTVARAVKVITGDE
jgi:hypothetical protein